MGTYYRLNDECAKCPDNPFLLIGALLLAVGPSVTKVAAVVDQALDAARAGLVAAGAPRGSPVGREALRTHALDHVFRLQHARRARRSRRGARRRRRTRRTSNKQRAWPAAPAAAAAATAARAP